MIHSRHNLIIQLLQIYMDLILSVVYVLQLLHIFFYIY